MHVQGPENALSHGESLRGHRTEGTHHGKVAGSIGDMKPLKAIIHPIHFVELGMGEVYVAVAVALSVK